jgi:hypothetical protein
VGVWSNYYRPTHPKSRAPRSLSEEVLARLEIDGLASLVPELSTLNGHHAEQVDFRKFVELVDQARMGWWGSRAPFKRTTEQGRIDRSMSVPKDPSRHLKPERAAE